MFLKSDSQICVYFLHLLFGRAIGWRQNDTVYKSPVNCTSAQSQKPCYCSSVWKQLHLEAGALPAAPFCFVTMLTRDCTAPERQNWAFVTPDNSRTSLLQPARVIRWGVDERYPILERWNGRSCLAAQHSGTGFVTEVPCCCNAACWGSAVPRAEAQPWRSSSQPRLLLCQTRNLSHCCYPLRLNSTSQLGGGSFFPPASFDCQTWLFGKLLRSYFFFCF